MKRVLLVSLPALLGLALGCTGVVVDTGDDTGDSAPDVVYDPPLVGFEAEQVGDSVVFTNTTAYADSFVWDFGDGTTSDESAPVHVYPALDEGVPSYVYTVTLTANGPGGEASASQEIEVFGDTYASFTWGPEGAVAGDEVAFTDTSVNAWTHEWDFGDGSELVTVQDPMHTFSEPGEYTVGLYVTGPVTSSFVSSRVLIGAPAPTAGIAYDDSERILEGVTEVAFSNASTYGDAWFWDFGDGEVSTEENPTHVFETAGVHLVTLTVENDAGSSTAEAYVDVFADPSGYGISVYQIEVHDMPFALSSNSYWTLPSTGTTLTDGTLDIWMYAGKADHFLDNYATAGSAAELYEYTSTLVKTAEDDGDFPLTMGNFSDIASGSFINLEFELSDDWWIFHSWEAGSGDGYRHLVHQVCEEGGEERYALHPYLHFTEVNALGYGAYTTTTNHDHSVDDGTSVTIRYRHTRAK